MSENVIFMILSGLLYTGFGIQLTISGKLLFQAPKTFINAIFMALTLTKTVVFPLQVFFLIEIGKDQMSDSVNPPKKNIEDCAWFLLAVITVNILDVVYNAGILFCRFVYARHAYDLTTC